MNKSRPTPSAQSPTTQLLIQCKLSFPQPPPLHKISPNPFIIKKDKIIPSKKKFPPNSHPIQKPRSLSTPTTYQTLTPKKDTHTHTTKNGSHHPKRRAPLHLPRENELWRLQRRRRARPQKTRRCGPSPPQGRGSSPFSPPPLAHAKKIGLSSYSVSLESQTADVYTADVEYETLLEKIKKTGKTVLGAERDGEKLEV